VLGEHGLGSGAVADVARPGADCTTGIVLLIAQVLGHLLVQRGLQHRLGQLLEQPVRAGQRQALFLRQPDQLSRGLLLGRCSAFFFVTSFSVVVTRRQPFPPSSRSASGRKHR
jgi:hypothetical protein